jgi:hypothetical protein
MIADNPSQLTSHDTGKSDEWEQAAIVLLRIYIRKRAAEGRDIQHLRQEMLESSLHPGILIKLFDRANEAA